MICVKCKADKPDVMRRYEIRLLDEKGNPIVNPPLCTDCCATFPGREWMRQS